MRILLISLTVATLTLLFSIGTLTDRADARPEYAKQFRLKYGGKDAPSDFKKAIRKAGCKVCHLPDKKDKPKDDHHKPRNGYGKALNEFLKEAAFEAYAAKKKEASRQDRKQLLAELNEQVLEAIEQAEEKHSDPEDDTSPTFRELFERHELPPNPPSE